MQAEKVLTVNMGPQHPSTHGVLRLRVKLEGEIIRDVEPIIGYLHRGVEKLAEDGYYLQFIPLTDRDDYLAAMHNNMGFCRAVEELMGIKTPERAEYIRVIAQELNRLASHYVWLGTFGLDLGAVTPFFWCFRDREEVLGLLESMCGARLTYSYMRFGGVRFDLPDGFEEKIADFLPRAEKRLAEMDRLLTKNEIFVARTKGVGAISKIDAINAGLTGPVLRACGVKFDIRKDDPYNVYPKLDFEVPTRTAGDCYARYEVRMEEMKQSIRILHQAMKQIPQGPYLSPDYDNAVKQMKLRPMKGESYARIESPRGELGYYVVADGGYKPFRVKIRAHSFQNLSALPQMVRGQKVPDLVATLGSIDIVLGDIDR